MARSFDFIWVQVFKNGTIKISGRRPLKNSTKPILEFLDPFIARRLSFMTETSWRCFCQWWVLGIFAGVPGSQVNFLFCFTGFVVFIFIFFVLPLFVKTVVPVYMFIIFFRDIKRDIAKKLEKLEKRTQKAIVEIIRKYFTLRYMFPNCFGRNHLFVLSRIIFKKLIPSIKI